MDTQEAAANGSRPIESFCALASVISASNSIWISACHLVAICSRHKAIIKVYPKYYICTFFLLFATAYITYASVNGFGVTSFMYICVLSSLIFGVK